MDTKTVAAKKQNNDLRKVKAKNLTEEDEETKVDVKEKDVKTIEIENEPDELVKEVIKEYQNVVLSSTVDVTKYIPGFVKLKSLDVIDTKPLLIVPNGKVWEVPDPSLFLKGKTVKTSNDFMQLCAQTAAELILKHDLPNGV